LAKLPNVFFPSQGQKKQPPTLHLGWLVVDSVLRRLAEERGIGVPVDYREILKDEDIELDDEEIEEEYRRYEISGPSSLHKIQAFVIRCSELRMIQKPFLALVYDSTTKGTSYVASLVTNFDYGSRRIAKSDWDKLVHEFKFEGEPKWYLDFDDWHWK